MDDRKIDKDERSVYMFALRYAIERNTSAIHVVTEQIRKHIDDFEFWEIDQMVDEIHFQLKLFPEKGNTILLTKFGKELIDEYISRLR